MVGSHPIDQEECPLPEEIARVTRLLKGHLGNRIHALALEWHSRGWVLSGSAATYHAKQVAQEAVMQMSALPILANRIQVRCRSARSPGHLPLKDDLMIGPERTGTPPLDVPEPSFWHPLGYSGV